MFFNPQTIVQRFDEKMPLVAGDLVTLASLSRAADLRLKEASIRLAAGLIGDDPELWRGWQLLASCAEA